MSQTPTSIGKYDVEGVVGEGAMGVVYRATDRVLNRRVAIKVMSDAIAKDTDLRARFLREAQAAGSLQHPNVVTIYDFGEVDDHLYIAMEYVEGEDLEDLLVRRVRLPLDGKLAITIDVLQGLAFAHKRGIVHRDIKPANVRVDQEGRARLMDFGIAHLDSAKMTRTGTMLGTPSYMAPEQIVGGIVTPATDIFSVGAVLYELLTGTRPFQGDSLQALMYQVLSQAPAPLHKLDPSLPAPLNDVVMRALQKEPAQRYPSALDMASDLTNVRATLGPEGGRSSLSLRATIDSALALRSSGMRERARRRRNYFVGGALAAVALMALVVQVPRQAAGGAEAISPGEVGPPAVVAVADTTKPAPTLQADVPDKSDSAEAVTLTPAPAERPSPSAVEVGRARRTQAAALTSRARAAAAGASEAETATVAAAETVALSSGPMSPTSLAQSPGPAVQDPGVPELPAPALPAPAPPIDHSAEIAAVVAAYASALQSRDIARLQRAYPGMTAEQRRAFSEFFRATRSLDVRLAVSLLQVDGPTAQAQLAGTYEFVTSSGSAERRPASFQAVLHREQGAWRLMSVR